MDFKNFLEQYQKVEVEDYPNNISNNICLSVIVQTYNHEKYIVECLDGILNQQTNFNFELLIGVDSSKDKTREICIEYANRFPNKIRLFLHRDENKIKIGDSPTGNFNAFYNFYQAKGKFIAFCEGDDFWNDPKKLQKQFDFLEKNSDFVLSYHLFIEKIEFQVNSKKQPLEQPTKDLCGRDLTGVFYHPLLSTCCFRNCFDELPKEMIHVVNVDTFLLSILGTFGKVKFLEDIHASTYRRHMGGIWTKNMKVTKLKSKILTFEKLFNYYRRKKNKEAQDLLKSRLLNLIKTSLLYNIKAGHLINVIETLRTYLRIKNIRS